MKRYNQEAMIVIPCAPPKTTAQEHKITVVNGKPRFYDPPKLKAVKEMYMNELSQYAPDEPISGPVALTVSWVYKANSRHGHAELKTTKPDTDNMMKALKDCMTKCGYWKDDAQVAIERSVKFYAEDFEGIIIEYNEVEIKGEIEIIDKEEMYDA